MQIDECYLHPTSFRHPPPVRPNLKQKLAITAVLHLFSPTKLLRKITTCAKRDSVQGKSPSSLYLLFLHHPASNKQAGGNTYYMKVDSVEWKAVLGLEVRGGWEEDCTVACLQSTFWPFLYPQGQQKILCSVPGRNPHLELGQLWTIFCCQTWKPFFTFPTTITRTTRKWQEH